MKSGKTLYSKVYVISLVALIIIFGYSQSFAYEWSKTFGQDHDQQGNSVQQTADGGFIIAGYERHFGSGGVYVYLIKTDGSGIEQWSKFGQMGGVNIGNSVQQTADGGFVIAGWMQEGNYYVGYQDDVYLIKTDGSGTEQWSKTFGGSHDEQGNSVQQTADGGFIIAGTIISYGAVLWDVYLIKTDGSGIEQWSKTFGGNDRDTGNSVQQTADGGFVIAGTTDSFGAGLSDVYLIKTDGSGTEQWSKTFGGSHDDRGNSVQQTADGGFVIAGETDSSGAGGVDVYLIKTDGSGTEQWSKTFGGSHDDRGNSVQQTADGGFVIAGETWSSGAGLWEVYLIKTDGSGTEQWSKTFGGSPYDRGNSVQQTADGGYIIAGSTAHYDEDVYLIYYKPLVWFVDGKNGIDPYNCSGGYSWQTAFETIGKAVECSDAVDQIWVKMGTYSLSESIIVDKAVRIYGGFNGTETELSQRSLEAKSIVDGQDSVRCFTVDADATIDGFKIVNGYTTQGGGGISIKLSAATVSNCIFSENQASWGGGMSIELSAATVSNCIFSENQASWGGGLHNRESSPTIINSTFSNNSANSGGAIMNYLQPSATITNCILWGDTATTGPEIYNSSSNPTVKYCDIDQGGYAGSNGNIRKDPLFIMNFSVGAVVEQFNTFHLRSDSPCIDAGTSQYAPNHDIDGDPRPWGAGFDIGADEYIPPEDYWTDDRMRDALPMPMPNPQVGTGSEQNELQENENPGFAPESEPQPIPD